MLEKRLLPYEPEEELEADRVMSGLAGIDIMAIVVIPLYEEELMDALSEVLVSMAMLALGGELGLE